MENNKSILLEFDVTEDGYKFPSSISSAILEANSELEELDERFAESIETIKNLTPECDKLDYILSASSGALCGIIDVFLVGKPGESPVGDITDKWFANRTTDFAKLCGYKGDDKSASSAIRFLENRFKVPYDQSVGRKISKEILNITPTNHHFKSLAHNPTLLGLFFSILDQFGEFNKTLGKFVSTSSFIFDGELITLNNFDGNFELEGHNVPSKLFCGFVKWFGHLISDISGSSNSKGRGMGIPSPIWSWTNDIIAIKRKLNIPASDFNKSVNELALKLFNEGYDSRFQTAQAIPVFLNELIVRLFYSIRRLVQFYSQVKKEERTFSSLWKFCEPFSNATVKRMLTVAHGSFCLIDLGDATIRGFIAGGCSFNVSEFFMRVNVVGAGRFTISLYGEAKRGIHKLSEQRELDFVRRDRIIVLDYLEGLKSLAEVYDDSLLLTFVDDFEDSEMFIEAFNKTVKLAELRNVPDDKILKTKSDIDSYFLGGVEGE